MSDIIQLKPIKITGAWLPALFVFAVGSILAIMLFAILAYQLLYLDRVYPGVLVDTIPVGGMTPSEVMAVVDARSPDYLQRPIVIQAGDETWRYTTQELGMRLNSAATADRAYAIGRQGNFIADMLTHLHLILNPHNINPIIEYESGPLDRLLQRLGSQINVPPEDAQLRIQPDATVEIIPGQRGRQLHIGATRARLEEAIFTNRNQPIQPVIQEVIPSITRDQVTTAYRQAQTLLSQPLVFSFHAETQTVHWRLEADALAGMLEIDQQVNPADGKTHLTLELEPNQFAPHLAEFAKTVNSEPKNARFDFDPETGQLSLVEAGLPGYTLDTEAAYARIAALPQEPIHHMELPVIITPPAISEDEIENMEITSLVGEATSYFKGSSAGRQKNIALAASKFHNVIIPPGGIFSFNEHLGEVSKESGYDESLIIYGNRTTVGIGGGVCQVSTTAFRAALFGGYEIIERWAHGYRVGWYETNSEPGLDATVYTPDVDLKFQNDTPHYLLIQTETDLAAGTLTFRLYSAETNRQVQLSEPKLTNIVEHGPPIYEDDPDLPKGETEQVDWAKDGMDVTITRTVTISDEVIHKDIIFSHYSPWQAVYKVGTAESEEAED